MIVIESPALPVTALRDLIFGACGITVNAIESLPPAVVTATVVAPSATSGTVNVIDVSVAPSAITAAVVPTASVAADKSVPVKVMTSPRAPESLLSDVIFGGATTV